MSYRLKLGIIQKEDYDELSGYSYKDYEKEYLSSDGLLPIISDLEEVEHIFLIGSYYDADIFDNLTLKPFFKDVELEEYYNAEKDLYLGTKEDLQSLIDYYVNRTINYYKNLLEEPSDYEKMYFNKSKEGTYKAKLERHIKNKKEFWEINKDMSRFEHSTLLMYTNSVEYEIFNLKYILNTTDWENKHLIIYGG